VGLPERDSGPRGQAGGKKCPRAAGSEGPWNAYVPVIDEARQ
jgi:hypothetical protein